MVSLSLLELLYLSPNNKKSKRAPLQLLFNSSLQCCSENMGVKHRRGTKVFILTQAKKTIMNIMLHFFQKSTLNWSFMKEILLPLTTNNVDFSLYGDRLDEMLASKWRLFRLRAFCKHIRHFNQDFIYSFFGHNSSWRITSDQTVLLAKRLCAELNRKTAARYEPESLFLPISLLLSLTLPSVIPTAWNNNR